MRTLVLVVVFIAGAFSGFAMSVGAYQGADGRVLAQISPRQRGASTNDMRTQLVTPQTDAQKITELQNAVAELQTQMQTMQSTMSALPPGDQILTRQSYTPGLHCDSYGAISPDDIMRRARVHIAAIQGDPDYYGANFMMPYWSNCHR
jgi:hypothetical protein